MVVSDGVYLVTTDVPFYEMSGPFVPVYESPGLCCVESLEAGMSMANYDN